MEIKDILQSCNCCISGKPLKDCLKINVIQLNYRAKWLRPIWSNNNNGYRHMAIAYVHDDCIDPKTKTHVGIIKHAIEFKGDEVIYHPVMIGTKCKKCGCTEGNCTQCIHKTGRPCYWVEKDLCSACEVKALYTIYKPIENHPRYPNKYIIARFPVIDGQLTPRDQTYLFTADDLEACRNEVQIKGLDNIGTDPENAQTNIIESWL